MRFIILSIINYCVRYRMVAMHSPPRLTLKTPQFGN